MISLAIMSVLLPLLLLTFLTHLPMNLCDILAMWTSLRPNMICLVSYPRSDNVLAFQTFHILQINHSPSTCLIPSTSQQMDLAGRCYDRYWKRTWLAIDFAFQCTIISGANCQLSGELSWISVNLIGIQSLTDILCLSWVTYYFQLGNWIIYFPQSISAVGSGRLNFRTTKKPLAAFNTTSGHYQFKKIAMGLHNLLLSFQCLMNFVLSGLIRIMGLCILLSRWHYCCLKHYPWSLGQSRKYLFQAFWSRFEAKALKVLLPQESDQIPRFHVDKDSIHALDDKTLGMT